MPAPPSGLALSADGGRLYITCAAAESRVCIVDTAKAKVIASIATGHTTLAPVLSPDEKTLFVCDRFNDSVSVIDLGKRKLIERIPVEREPVAAAITPDGKFLLVANHIHAGRSDFGVVAASVSVIDTVTRKRVKNIPLPNGSTLLRGICVSPDGRFVAVTHILARYHLPTTQVEHGWMNDNALSLIDVANSKLLNTVLLDDVDRGAANPWAVAWGADGKHIVITHAGTHELSVIDAQALLAKLASLPERLSEASAGRLNDSTVARVAADVSNDLAFLVGLRTRIQLPGNGPRTLALAGDRAFVGCYFSDSLAVVDLTAPLSRPHETRLKSETPAREAPAAVGLRRKGEMYFNDGKLCFQGWQSCASCHSSDARVDGMNWDLLNDGIGNPKNVKSLLLCFQTGPAMATGVRANAGVAVRAGIRHILFSSVSDEYPSAIDEYLKSLQPIPSPYLVQGRLSSAAERGKKLFFSPRTGCGTCHPAGLFTDLEAHDVGSAGKFDERADRFYTPTLVELWRTAPYLHDGSAATVREVLTSGNRMDRHGKTSQLTPAQIDDLAAYLLSL